MLVLDKRFAKYKIASTPIQRLFTGSQWTEGPAWNGVGCYLVWSDIPNNVQYRWPCEDGHVGLALYGLPLYYDFIVRDFGWSRTQVTSGNAISKLIVEPLFGFIAGWLVDRFGPRRLMPAGAVMADGALIGN